MLGVAAATANLRGVSGHLGQLTPPTVLIEKQLVHYAASLWAPPAPQLGTLPPQLPGHPHHATRVWDIILAMELPLNNPLQIALVYCQQFVLHHCAAPSIASLYTEALTLL